MPRKRGIKQNFTFNKGWNTEASPMTFPENTAKDLDNVVLDVDGSIRRRMGVVCESATSTRYFQEIKSGFKYKAIGFFKWTNVAGSGDFNLLVSQKGTVLQFNGEDGTDYGQVDFSSRAITARLSEAPNEVVETASGLGYFFVTGPSIDPFYLEYDVSTDTISLTGFEIQIRDFDGVDDGLAVDERPTTLSAAHEYNLRNQGWLDSFPCIDDASAKSTDDTVGFTFTEIGSYPSNADVLYYGKTSTGADESEIDRYNPTVMVKNVFGTTPAPKGKYIFNAFNLDRNSIVAGATSEIVNNRPRAVGFHNGRVFFAGVNAVGYTGKVYYSQQLTNIDKIGKCYQDNDPTSEIFNDLLATDGGEIDIPNCGNILRIEEGPAGIVVFASNGMWEITGQEGKFSATEFFVRKVTDIGCVSRESVVNADGTFYYFSDAGIVGTSRDQVSGNLSADVITQTSIQLGYLLFGGPQRRGARGVWIRGEKKVVWLYSTDATYDNVVDRFKYNGVLILDTILGAFYKYSISDFNVGEAPFVSGIVESSSTVSITTQEPVTAGTVTVTAGGSDVTIPVSGSDADTVTSTWKLQVVRPTTVGTTTAWGIDFATFASRTFTDWYWEDSAGANYTSYLETGYDYGGEAMFEKRPTYVYTYMSRVSKSNLDGGYYNIPDPTETIVASDVCFEIAVINGAAPTQQVDFNADFTDAGSQTNGGFWLKPDGTKLYVSEVKAAAPVIHLIHEYDLTTPYDLTTAVYTGNYADVDQDASKTSGVSGTLERFTISPDGLKLYTIDGSLGDIMEWSMTVPWDISTLSSTWDYTRDIGAESYLGTPHTFPGPTGVAVNADGSKMYISYVTSSGADPVAHIREYNLVTPYSINGMTLSQVASVTGYGYSTNDSVFMGPDSNRLYMLNFNGAGNATIDYFSMTGGDISTLTYEKSSSPGTSQNIEQMQFSPEGDYLFGVVQGDYYIMRWDLDCDLCGTCSVPLIPSQTYSDTHGVTYVSVAWKPDGTKFWGGVSGSQVMYENNLSTAWDLTTATAGTTVTTTGYQNRQFAFMNNGLRYLSYTSGSTKNMFTCADHDLSSGFSYLGSRTVAGFPINASAKGDGSFGIINGDIIYLYTTGGDWDDGGNNPSVLSQWDYATAVSNAGLTMGAATREDGGFSNDGTKVYVATAPYDSATKIDIVIGTMSTPWDLSTTTLDCIWTVNSSGLAAVGGEVRVIEDLTDPHTEFLINSESTYDMVKYVPTC